MSNLWLQTEFAGANNFGCFQKGGGGKKKEKEIKKKKTEKNTLKTGKAAIQI